MKRGPLPVTKADIRLSKKHLQATIKLEKSKVADHLSAFQAASNPGSKKYHKAHAKAHKKDIKARLKYMKKISKL